MILAMNTAPASAAARSQVESMLGRRLRPWWGTPPWKLLIRGIVGVVVFAVLVYASIEVRAGELDLTGSGLEDRKDTIDLVALVVGILAAIGVVYRLVQIVVGALDLVPRREYEGVLVEARSRRTGDFLPGIVQTLWYRRSDAHGYQREQSRRTRYEVVIETSRGLRSWNVRPKFIQGAPRGQTVRLVASPLLGHVTSIEAIPTAEHDL